MSLFRVPLGGGGSSGEGDGLVFQGSYNMDSSKKYGDSVTTMTIPFDCKVAFWVNMKEHHPEVYKQNYFYLNGKPYYLPWSGSNTYTYNNIPAGAQLRWFYGSNYETNEGHVAIYFDWKFTITKI